MGERGGRLCHAMGTSRWRASARSLSPPNTLLSIPLLLTLVSSIFTLPQMMVPTSLKRLGAMRPHDVGLNSEKDEVCSFPVFCAAVQLGLSVQRRCLCFPASPEQALRVVAHDGSRGELRGSGAEGFHFPLPLASLLSVLLINALHSRRLSGTTSSGDGEYSFAVDAFSSLIDTPTAGISPLDG